MLEIIPMQPAHLDSVWRIEQQAHSHPWAESLIRDLSSRGACHHVMYYQGEVIGYFYAQNIVGEITLLNVAVAPQWQGQGFGTKLVDAFADFCQSKQAESAWLEVRESNHGAIHVYQEAGFHEVDRRVNYYPSNQKNKKSGQKEDAVIMSMLFLF